MDELLGEVSGEDRPREVVLGVDEDHIDRNGLPPCFGGEQSGLGIVCFMQGLIGAGQGLRGGVEVPSLALLIAIIASDFAAPAVLMIWNATV